MVYLKLVRDNIPQIIEESGKNAIVHTLDDKEFEVFLERKLDEEVGEYHESKDPEELADILEVLIALAKSKGISFDDLVDLQKQKAAKRGGFSKKLFLIAVSEEKNNE
ncbi:MAG: nucleoside triphosphate pyrophosphohydrolase [Lachnospiraceae bacterium]|nr:nucleoside triphosphate pyrophosphohydrolase [Lachnospiraceae bacterium]